MKRIIITFALLFIVVAFTASGALQSERLSVEPGPDEQMITVYFPAGDMSGFNEPALRPERRLIKKAADADELSRLVLEELIKGPVDSSLRGVFSGGSGVKWVSLAMGWAGIGLSGGFAYPDPPEITLGKYCIVLSLAQSLAETITLREISLYMNDMLVKNEDSPSGILSPQDVVLGMTDKPISYRLTLFYPNDDSSALLSQTRNVEISTSLRVEDYIMQELMQPSDDSMPMVVPEEAELLSLSTDYGICHVDFSAEFAEVLGRTPRRARAVIYSIVNSLCGSESVQRVRISVEGESDMRIGGTDISGYLTVAEALY